MKESSLIKFSYFFYDAMLIYTVWINWTRSLFALRRGGCVQQRGPPGGSEPPGRESGRQQRNCALLWRTRHRKLLPWQPIWLRPWQLRLWWRFPWLLSSQIVDLGINFFRRGFKILLWVNKGQIWKFGIKSKKGFKLTIYNQYFFFYISIWYWVYCLYFCSLHDKLLCEYKLFG